MEKITKMKQGEISLLEREEAEKARLMHENWQRQAKEQPVFENTAFCLACGKEKFVNTSGFCEKCWISFAHTRNNMKRSETNE